MAELRPLRFNPGIMKARILHRLPVLLASAALLISFQNLLADASSLTRPIIGPEVVFEEVNGQVAVEAEHFYKQTLIGKRAWYRVTAQDRPQLEPDADGPHLQGASGGAYLEILPDTRRNHSEKLIQGENFSDQPGLLAVLHYKVHFNTPGRYYVWARSFSTGSEDNGVHFGLDGQWPASGQRWQTVAKNQWSWDSKQRTAENHTGEPGKLFLDIDQPGEHEVMVSLREDGFELDKWGLTTQRPDIKWEGVGPTPRVKKGRLPAAFALPANYQEAGDRAVAATPKAAPLVEPRRPDGGGQVDISGELKQWHKVNLTLDGPFAHERDNKPNPFTDLRMTVAFQHESGAPSYTVPGYFAADGKAGNSSAEAGTKWRAHLSPDKPGRWTYTVSFVTGKMVALEAKNSGQAIERYHGKTGTFNIQPTDKKGRDFRARGRLQYVGGHHLRFASSGEYFLKAGADSPENLLAYDDFDGTQSNKKQVSRQGEATTPGALKTWQPHLQDWKAGDPTWKGDKGKELIGALNYLAGKGMNAFSFLTYNAGGDGDDVWPFIARDEKLHYDCSKLDQWGVVFDHATQLGLYLHFKLQETENDDTRRGDKGERGEVPTALDGGDLGPERQLYLRELIARFGHALALNWNLGEENTQSPEQQRAMARYIHDTDPYHHLIVIHTYPNWQDRVYPKLLGDQSVLTGASLQNGWSQTHERTVKWVVESAQAGKPWVVANDEQGPANLGAPPDPGYAGFKGQAIENKNKPYDLHDIRKATLWGNLMAGGAGVEYYFGYSLPQNDLQCQDWRSRDQSWDYARIALEFFHENQIPFWEMRNADALIGNQKHDNSKFCLAKPGALYLVYLPNGGTTEVDLSKANGSFTVKWFNPRRGGPLQSGSVTQVKGGGKAGIGQPPLEGQEDWLAILRK